MSHPRLISRFGLPALSASLLSTKGGTVVSNIYKRSRVTVTRRPGLVLTTVVVLVIGIIAAVRTSQAALVIGGIAPSIIFGRDDDNLNNPFVQPVGVAANQSLNNTDVLVGRSGNDVMVGLLGSDVMFAGAGNDIIIGGPEQGTTPNSDVMFGDDGDDINIWAPGDGSELFVGGTGRDAIIFGVIDKDVSNRPTSAGPAPGFAHIPSANVSGMGGFCTIQRIEDPSVGYEFLAKFFVRATGTLAVTVRLREVEQIFCASQLGGQVTYADLSQPNPEFVVITLGDALAINNIVGRIIR